MKKGRRVMKKPIGKFNKAGELSWVFAIILVAFGVSLCKKADLGVSMVAAPPFIVYEAVGKYWSGFSVGMLEYLIQGLVLIIMCVAVQRFNWRYLLAFACAVIYGYTLDLWFLILGKEAFRPLYLRWIMLIVGDSITAIGVALYFRTYMPLQVYELFVAELSDRYKLNVNRTKLIYDISSLVLSACLAVILFRDVTTFDWKSIYYTSYHSIGLGTIVTTLINAPLITLFGKLLDKFLNYEPMFPKLYKVLARNGNKNEENKEEECLISE